jgi:Tfp pilus assembly protein PilV
LTIIEVLVSLVLLGSVVFVVQGFLIPLQVTRASSLEIQGLSYARSYVELTKARWLVNASYGTTTANAVWPTWGSSGTVDLQVGTGWTVTRTIAVIPTATTADTRFQVAALASLADTLRQVTVTVTPPTGSGGKPITLTTLIGRPNSGVVVSQ